MPGIARSMVDLAGGPIVASQVMFKVGGVPVCRLGDTVLPHGPNIHSGGVVMIGSSIFFKVQGVPVCRTSDLASCGHSVSPGSTWFKVNS